MPGDLARIGRTTATVEDVEALWQANRQATDRIEDVAEALAIIAGLVEWLVVAMPSQKVSRDKAARLQEVDDARALAAPREDDGL